MRAVCGESARPKAAALVCGASLCSVAALFLLWGTAPAALALGALGALGLAAAAGAALARRRRRVRREGVERDTVKARVLWSTLADIRPGGWVQRDLESLRLLALNVTPAQPLGARFAARLDSAVAAVFLRSLDRLDDIARLSGALDVAPGVTRRLVVALRVLATELAGVKNRPGAPAPFRPQAVAAACGVALEACHELDAAVRPSVAADLAVLARRVAFLRYRSRVDSGALKLDVAESRGRLAAVRSADLAEAIDGALHLVLAGARHGGPVSLRVVDGGAAATVEIAWSANVTPAEGRVLIEPLRPLTAYGARVFWEQVVQAKAVRLVAELPLAETGADETPAGAPYKVRWYWAGSRRQTGTPQ